MNDVRAHIHNTECVNVMSTLDHCIVMVMKAIVTKSLSYCSSGIVREERGYPVGTPNSGVPTRYPRSSLTILSQCERSRATS